MRLLKAIAKLLSHQPSLLDSILYTWRSSTIGEGLTKFWAMVSPLVSRQTTRRMDHGKIQKAEGVYWHNWTSYTLVFNFHWPTDIFNTTMSLAEAFLQYWFREGWHVLYFFFFNFCCTKWSAFTTEVGWFSIQFCLAWSIFFLPHWYSKVLYMNRLAWQTGGPTDLTLCSGFHWKIAFV